MPLGQLLAVMLAVMVAGGSLTACGGSAGQQTPPTVEPASAPPRPTGSPARADVPTRLAPTAQASPSPEPLVALATADAALRAGTTPGDVRIVSVEAREWPDRSLGCPRPGMGYAQAITPGYLIVAETAGQLFEYHTDHAQVVLCAP